jgi:predicted dienelactone hydrolase
MLAITRSLTARLFSAALLSLLMSRADAFEVGWRQMTVASPAGAAPIAVALYYPTDARAREIPMGPFVLHVAIQAPPQARTKGLIVLSHGTGGSELAHSSLAEALARDGYLVAALRHPGDNWQDRSLLSDRSGGFFTERPKQVTRVIDALLKDPQWKDRIAADAQGPRIGAVGHSAGGYTVLALAGGVPDMSRVLAHCRDERADDPVFCAVARSESPASAPRPSLPTLPIGSLADPRIRAAVALAPLGSVFTAQSLAKIRIPLALYEAEKDSFLVPRFHAEWVSQNVPGVQMHRVPNAGHFAFLDRPTMPVASDDGDAGADPPGFDRPAFLGHLAQELTAFFDQAFP